MAKIKHTPGESNLSSNAEKRHDEVMKDMGIQEQAEGHRLHRELLSMAHSMYRSSEGSEPRDRS